MNDMLITKWLIYNVKNNVKSKACWSGGWVSARVSEWRESMSAWVSDVSQWVTWVSEWRESVSVCHSKWRDGWRYDKQADVLFIKSV